MKNLGRNTLFGLIAVAAGSFASAPADAANSHPNRHDRKVERVVNQLRVADYRPQRCIRLIRDRYGRTIAVLSRHCGKRAPVRSVRPRRNHRDRYVRSARPYRDHRNRYPAARVLYWLPVR